MRLGVVLTCWCLLVFALAVVAAPPRAYEDPKMVVIDTSVPGIVTGETLYVTKFLNIAHGQYLRVLTPDGEMLDLVGPHQGPAQTVVSSVKEPMDSSFFDDLSALVFRQGQKADAVGAIRSLDIGNPPPKYHPREVVIAGGQRVRVCLENSQTLSLTRNHNPGNEIQLWIISGRGKESEYDWPMRDLRFKVPAKVLSGQPSRLIFLLGEQGDRTQVNMNYASPENPGHQLLWFQQKGCKQQLQDALRYYREN